MAAFLSAAFVAWRLAKTYDLNEERVLDLVILTFLGGILGARIFFVATHWSLFADIGKAVLLNRYPGLSFWGGIFGGIIALRVFASRTKLNLWQIADFAVVGLALGLVFGDLGCFFGGCGYGAVSDLPVATAVVGLVGKRFPVSALESILFLFLFFSLWKQAVRFHFGGKIASVGLVALGVVKFVTEYFRGDSQPLPFIRFLAWGHLFSIALTILGIALFYRLSKRDIRGDLTLLRMFVTSAKKREIILSKISKSWYNHRVGLRLHLGKVRTGLQSLPKAVRRKLNVKPTPSKLSQD